MSHFAVVVLTKAAADDRDAVLADVERLLAPYDEAGEWFADGSRWDWWQIGGRFTGALDGYDPGEDPENLTACEVCEGTGTRPEWPVETSPEWIVECNGCNGCHGQGQHLKWPSEWADHAGDIMATLEAHTIGNAFVPAAVVTPDGEWHEEGRVGWWGVTIETVESPGDWRMCVQRLMEAHADTTAVIVDCHV